MHRDTNAALLCVDEQLVRLELHRAIRRSEPDTREVSGVIRGHFFVATRECGSTAWTIEPRDRPARSQWAVQRD